jgi:hypothetical protein
MSILYCPPPLNDRCCLAATCSGLIVIMPRYSQCCVTIVPVIEPQNPKQPVDDKPNDDTSQHHTHTHKYRLVWDSWKVGWFVCVYLLSCNAIRVDDGHFRLGYPLQLPTFQHFNVILIRFLQKLLAVDSHIDRAIVPHGIRKPVEGDDLDTRGVESLK